MLNLLTGSLLRAGWATHLKSGKSLQRELLCFLSGSLRVLMFGHDKVGRQPLNGVRERWQASPPASSSALWRLCSVWQEANFSSQPWCCCSAPRTEKLWFRLERVNPTSNLRDFGCGGLEARLADCGTRLAAHVFDTFEL